jgi:hypothetical protein
MRITNALFFELMSDFQSERWNEFVSPKLALGELLVLAKFVGAPSSGTKKRLLYVSSHNVNCA